MSVYLDLNQFGLWAINQRRNIDDIDWPYKLDRILGPNPEVQSGGFGLMQSAWRPANPSWRI